MAGRVQHSTVLFDVLPLRVLQVSAWARVTSGLQLIIIRHLTHVGRQQLNDIPVHDTEETITEVPAPCMTFPSMMSDFPPTTAGRHYVVCIWQGTLKEFTKYTSLLYLDVVTSEIK